MRRRNVSRNAVLDILSIERTFSLLWDSFSVKLSNYTRIQLPRGDGIILCELSES